MTPYDLVKSWGALNLVWPDRTSATAILGRMPSLDERIYWTKLVRKTYGAPALKAGYAIFGRALTLDDLAHVAKNPQPWAARAKEGVGLAPLLTTFVRARQPAPANFKQLRESTLARGLTSFSWKWLCHQHPATVARLFAFGWADEAIWWANLLSKAVAGKKLDPVWVENGRAYLQQSLYESVRQIRSTAETHILTLQLERLFRMVPQKADPKSLVEYELISYAFLAGIRVPELQLSVAPGRSWSSLLVSVRRQNDRRAAIALELARVRVAAQEKADTFAAVASWPARIGSGMLENIQVQELTQAKDLEVEGAIMSHCVGNGGYLLECISGGHTVLSLLEPVSHARATLQLVKQPGSATVRIGQLTGPANSSVPQVFWKVARALACGVRPNPA